MANGQRRSTGVLIEIDVAGRAAELAGSSGHSVDSQINRRRRAGPVTDIVARFECQFIGGHKHGVQRLHDVGVRLQMRVPTSRHVGVERQVIAGSVDNDHQVARAVRDDVSVDRNVSVFGSQIDRAVRGRDREPVDLASASDQVVDGPNDEITTSGVFIDVNVSIHVLSRDRRQRADSQIQSRSTFVRADIATGFQRQSICNDDEIVRGVLRDVLRGLEMSIVR